MGDTTTEWDSVKAYRAAIEYCLLNPVPSEMRRDMGPVGFARACPRHIDLGARTGKTTAAINAGTLIDPVPLIVVSDFALKSLYRKRLYTKTVEVGSLQHMREIDEIDPRKDRFIFDNVSGARQVAEDLRLEYFVILGQGGCVEE